MRGLSKHKDSFLSILRHVGIGVNCEFDEVYSMFRNSGEAWLVTDALGGLLFATDAWEAAFPSKGDAGKSGLYNLRMHASDSIAASEVERLSLGSSSGVGLTGEICISTDNQQKIWWQLTATPDQAGRVFWRAVDVTLDRERASWFQLEAEKLRSFLEDLPVGFFMLNRSGMFVYANSTFARWLERDSGDLSSCDIAYSAIQNDGESLSEDRVSYVELKAVSGISFRAFIIQNSFGDGGVRAVVLRDPELSKDVESGFNIVRQEDADLQISKWLYDDSPIGIALLEEDGSIKSCNLAFARFFGVDQTFLIGSMLSSNVSKEDKEELIAALSKLVMGTANKVQAEVRLSGDGSDVRAASLHASRIERDFTGVGNNNLIIVHVIDETEQRHLEVQFTQSQKMQAIGQLAGGIAHDFNNLLTAMIGFCDLLLQRHGPDDPSFSDIHQIQQNANRATNLVRQLLAFSRKQTLEPIVLDPTEVLSDLSHLLGRLIGEQVELRLEHKSGAHLIRADRGQFDQVIINLVVNARDAMPGGGTLSVTTRNENLLAPVQRGTEIMLPGAYVVVEVADTGTGIAKENLEHIFEPFFSTKEVGAGTGLGLSTVYGIVRQSDGYIFVDSAAGHGTKFSIYLPAYGAEGEVGSDAAAAADRALADRHAEVNLHSSGGGDVVDLTGQGVILLVEDEDAVRLFGARALKNKGYTVLEADNGESALDVINATNHLIDLIISDVVMPGMDGHTFVQLVRQELPDTKVILMSGYAEDTFREEISRDPTIHFLSKPFSLKALAGAVKEVLST